MYFFIKYIDYGNFKKIEDLDSFGESVTKFSPSTNKELLVNCDCYIGIIIDYIYQEVGVEDDERDNFDIVTEKGKLLNVNSYAPQISGREIFKEKNTYYIVRCGEELMPLLSKLSREYTDFLAYQRRRSSLQKRRSSASKSSRGSIQSREKKSSGKSLK